MSATAVNQEKIIQLLKMLVKHSNFYSGKSNEDVDKV